MQTVEACGSRAENSGLAASGMQDIGLFSPGS
jgi:hypothetical protein